MGGKLETNHFSARATEVTPTGCGPVGAQTKGATTSTGDGDSRTTDANWEAVCGGTMRASFFRQGRARSREGGRFTPLHLLVVGVGGDG